MELKLDLASVRPVESTQNMPHICAMNIGQGKRFILTISN